MNLETSLLNTPHIIENIFKYLPAVDLCRYASVNKLWNHLSSIEINRRRKTVYFYQTLKCSSHKIGSHANIQVCLLQNSGRFEEEFDLLIRNLEIKPAFCIAFANLEFWKKFGLLFPSHPLYSYPPYDGYATCRKIYFESAIRTALKKRLPRNCQIGLYIGRAIIDDRQKYFERVHKDKQVPSISGYFVPELPKQGIQFCEMGNYEREVFRIITTQNNLKRALALMEHKTIANFIFGLEFIQKLFNVFEEGIVFPVEIGSGIVPLFFEPNVETHFVKIPISDDNDNRLVKRLEKNGAVALVFGQNYGTCMNALKEFRQEYPLIPFVGLCGHSLKCFETQEKTNFYRQWFKSQVNLNFECKCMLISIKY